MTEDTIVLHYVLIRATLPTFQTQLNTLCRLGIFHIHNTIQLGGKTWRDVPKEM